MIRELPDPTTEQVAIWLKHVGRHDLHGDGWIAINQRFHGIASAVRPYLRKHFDNPKEQEAAFDGIVLALLAAAHFEDIEELSELLKESEE